MTECSNCGNLLDEDADKLIEILRQELRYGNRIFDIRYGNISQHEALILLRIIVKEIESRTALI